jgi:GDPmannose 4,6-dehydratase
MADAAPRRTDLVVAIGRTVSLRFFVERVFAFRGVAWSDHVEQDGALFHTSDIRYGADDPSLTAQVMGKRPRTGVEDVGRSICDAVGRPLCA